MGLLERLGIRKTIGQNFKSEAIRNVIRGDGDIVIRIGEQPPFFVSSCPDKQAVDDIFRQAKLSQKASVTVLDSYGREVNQYTFGVSEEILKNLD